MFKFIFLLVWIQSTIALGQEVETPFLEQLTKVDFVGKLFAFGAIVQLTLYCVAEILTRLSAWIDTKSPAKPWLQKTAAYASEASWFLGSMLGKFGYSVPKLVIEEKAKALVK